VTVSKKLPQLTLTAPIFERQGKMWGIIILKMGAPFSWHCRALTLQTPLWTQR